MTALQIADLNVRLAGRQILTDVNLEARPGELIGLLGPNLSLIHISEPTRPY